jgi:hypothetical protein
MRDERLRRGEVSLIVYRLSALALLVAASSPISCGGVRADVPSRPPTPLSKCVKTSHPGEQNYYQEVSECSKAANWTLVVQAESGTLGKSCIGPNDQSFLVNGPQSPVTLGWVPHGPGQPSKWTVNLKVDTSKRTVCPNQYTFFGFFDHIEHGGAPLPNLPDLKSSHELSYEQFADSGGEVRLTLGAQIFWGGKAHLLELLPAKIGYNANPGFPPGVIQKITTPTFEYVIIDDTWGTRVNPNGSTQLLTINWAALFSKLITLGMFTDPKGGPTATQAIYVAVETHNKAVGNLYQTKFSTRAN